MLSLIVLGIVGASLAVYFLYDRVNKLEKEVKRLKQLTMPAQKESSRQAVSDKELEEASILAGTPENLTAMPQKPDESAELYEDDKSADGSVMEDKIVIDNGDGIADQFGYNEKIRPNTHLSEEKPAQPGSAAGQASAGIPETAESADGNHADSVIIYDDDVSSDGSVTEDKIIIDNGDGIADQFGYNEKIRPNTHLSADKSAVIKTSSASAENGKISAGAKEVNESWELFTGIKLFAWLGGFAAFLGIIFFIKYTIDTGWFTPFNRIVCGYIAGAAAVAAGVLIKNKKFSVTSSVLAAVGIVFLYASTYAANVLYGFFGTAFAYLMMIIISVIAFLAAVDKNSKYIALLAGAGGYLTPLLLKVPLYGALEFIAVYSAILTAAVMFVAFKKNWSFLSWVALFGSVAILMMLRDGISVLTVYDSMTMCMIYAAFALLFLFFGLFAADRENFRPKEYAPVSFIFIFVSLFFVPSFFRIWIPAYAGLALLFTLNAMLLVFKLTDTKFKNAYSAAGGFILLILMYWTFRLSASVQPVYMFGAYFMFFLLNGFIPALSDYRKKIVPSVISGLYPALLLFVITIYVIKADYVSIWAWVVIAIAGFFSLSAAAFLRNIFIGLFAAFGIFVPLLSWIFSTKGVILYPSFFAVLTLFSVLFFLAGVLFKKRIPAVSKAFGIEPPQGENIPLYPVFNIYMLAPFFLLFVAMIKMKPASPTLFFSAGLITSALILILSQINNSKNAVTFFLSMCAMFVIQLLWQRFYSFITDPWFAVCWYFVIFVFYYAFVLVMYKRYSKTKFPWFTAGLAGVFQGILIYLAVRKIPGTENFIWTVPAFFALVYSVTFAFTERIKEPEKIFAVYRSEVFVNFILLFITLVFPAQFGGPLLTALLALEGVMLVAVSRFVSFAAVKKWGFWLLAVTFLRLVIPDIYLFTVSAGNTINGYFYLYISVIISTFAAAVIWRPKQGKAAWFANNRDTLFVFGTVLLFVLMNIEIAAFFATEHFINFKLSNSLAQDMSYTLGWGLFAIVLFINGVLKYSKGTRVAGLVLLTAATLKLFLHDLWSLGQFYRVGSLFGLAAMLIFVSFLYQKYIGKIREKDKNL